MPRRSLLPMMQELLQGGHEGNAIVDWQTDRVWLLVNFRFRDSVRFRGFRPGSLPNHRMWSFLFYISFGKECVEIARAVENANDFNAGAIGKFALENEIVSEVCDCPGTNVFVTAELPPSAQGGIACQEIKAVKNCLFDAIRRLGVVRTNVGVDQVHIRDGLFGKDELNHGRDGGWQRVGAGLLPRRPPGCLCPHRVP